MKKFFCNYCGEECEPTPQYHIPVEKRATEYINGKGNKIIGTIKLPPQIEAEQVDICNACQHRIVALLRMVKNVNMEPDGTFSLIFNPESKGDT